MKIGLLRHFKVDLRSPKYCNSEEYDKVSADYDRAEIIPVSIDIAGRDYSICYAGSMKRVQETARLVYDQEIIITDELAEIPLKAIFKTKLKLPFKLWHIINRVGWLLNSKKVPETKRQSHQRAVSFLAKVMASNHKNVLIVSHGLFMVTLQIELSRMGFKGEPFFRAEQSELYEFVRPD